MPFFESGNSGGGSGGGNVCSGGSFKQLRKIKNKG